MQSQQPDKQLPPYYQGGTEPPPPYPQQSYYYAGGPPSAQQVQHPGQQQGYNPQGGYGGPSQSNYLGQPQPNYSGPIQYGGPVHQNYSGPSPQPMYAYPQAPPPPGTYAGEHYAVNIGHERPPPQAPSGGNWGQQDWYIGEDKKLTADVDRSIRMGFVRKVYMILTAQLLVTFGIALVFALSDSAANWLVRNFWVSIVCMVLSMAVVCGMACVPRLARQVPTNYIMLTTLAIAMGLIMGYAAGSVKTISFALAVGMTCAVCLAVSLFACQTKADFTGIGIYGFVVFILLMVFGLVAAIMRSRIMQIVYATLGAAVFSFYLIMDTQKVVGGKHRKYEFAIDDYAFAALALYMDVINIFMFILQILSMSDN